VTVKRKVHPQNLAWVDLEMTGLDPQTDVILQVALIVTNRELEPLESYVADVWQPESALESMVPFVRAMHEKTGLLARVHKSDVHLAQAERELMTRIAGWCSYPATLCGNSVGTDKTFIDRWMPALAGFLHYRIVDVSSLKVLSQLWNPQARFSKPNEREHDALYDIENSIAELRHYRKELFK
jgi:oligoribonuclease